MRITVGPCLVLALSACTAKGGPSSEGRGAGDSATQERREDQAALRRALGEGKADAVELLLVEAHGDEQLVLFVFEREAPDQPEGVVGDIELARVARLGDSGFEVRARRSLLAAAGTPEPAPQGQSLRIDDLDGDGRMEVVALTSASLPTRSSPTIPASGAVAHILDLDDFHVQFASTRRYVGPGDDGPTQREVTWTFEDRDEDGHQDLALLGAGRDQPYDYHVDCLYVPRADVWTCKHWLGQELVDAEAEIRARLEATKPPPRDCSAGERYARAAAEVLRPRICPKDEPDCAMGCKPNDDVELDTCQPAGFTALRCRTSDSSLPNTDWIGYVSGDQAWVLDVPLSRLPEGRESIVSLSWATALSEADPRSEAGALYELSGTIEDDWPGNDFRNVGFEAEIYCQLDAGRPRCSQTLVTEYGFEQDWHGRYVSSKFEATLELDGEASALKVEASKLDQPREDPAREGRLGLTFLDSKTYPLAKLLRREMVLVELGE